MIYQPPVQTELNILYSDQDILAVDKPAGLLSVPGRGPDRQDCLLSRVQQLFADALVVHRLDMSTSGVMILARNAAAQRQLSRQFELRQIKKSYLAIVSGRVDPHAGQIDLPLICDWPNRPRQIVDHSMGKPARTAYRVLSHDSATDTTRIELKPVTGRTHQLRVHMQALGHPVLGDDLYADEANRKKSARLLLHATTLELAHPTKLETMIFTRPAPF